MLAVIKHALDAVFFFKQHDGLVHNTWCMQHGSVAAMQKFISSTAIWPQQAINELNWLQYKICGVIRHYEYELQDSNIEEIKQQLAGLRQTINTAFERRDFRLFVFPQVEQKH